MIPVELVSAFSLGAFVGAGVVSWWHSRPVSRPASFGYRWVVKVRLLCFPNGMVAAFPDGPMSPASNDGGPIGEAQGSWFALYLEHLERLGFDPTKCTAQLPNGLTVYPFPIDTDDTRPGAIRWNYTHVPDDAARFQRRYRERHPDR